MDSYDKIRPVLTEHEENLRNSLMVPIEQNEDEVISLTITGERR